MVKRVQDQDAGGRVRKKANTPRDNDSPSPSTTCAFCDHKFTTRGLTKHQNHCKSKQAAGKQPRCYKFCILNETLFEIILSFLNNQALTKMQMITGDRYPNCVPRLARYCCKCEEGNPVIQYGRCRECNTTGTYLHPKLTKEVAREKYCLRHKDFKGMRRVHMYGDYSRYDQRELEVCAIALHGSKQAWLREIARRKNLVVEKQQRTDHLESLAPGFAKFVEDINWKRRDKMLLKQMSERFKNVNAALEQHGLSLRTYSTPCMEFITTGSGDIQDVIERQFVLAQGSYWQLLREKTAIARAGLADNFCSSEMRLEMERGCEEAAKMELCVQFLQGSQGFTLPQKWENCRARLEEVETSGRDPLSMVDYIYAGLGGPPALQDNIDSDAAAPAQT